MAVRMWLLCYLQIKYIISWAKGKPYRGYYHSLPEVLMQHPKRYPQVPGLQGCRWRRSYFSGIEWDKTIRNHMLLSRVSLSKNQNTPPPPRYFQWQLLLTEFYPQQDRFQGEGSPNLHLDRQDLGVVCLLFLFWNHSEWKLLKVRSVHTLQSKISERWRRTTSYWLQTHLGWWTHPTYPQCCSLFHKTSSVGIRVSVEKSAVTNISGNENCEWLELFPLASRQGRHTR